MLMNTEEEQFMIRWLQEQLESSEDGLRRSGYYNDPELLTDLVKDEGPRVNQIIQAFQLGVSYERHRITKFLIGELEREQPFIFEIAKERIKQLERMELSQAQGGEPR